MTKICQLPLWEGDWKGEDIVKQREPGEAASLGARLRNYGDWADIRIANVSSRGFMGKASNPPGRWPQLDRHRG